MKNLLPILADVANGIFATLLASWIVDINPTWHFAVGILFAMLPDVDAVVEFLKRGVVSASAEHPEDHRSGFHYPILFIIAGTAGIYFFGFWGWLFAIATVLHFLNDFYGTGWGIPIFWPITSRRYKLFSRRANLPKKMLVERNYWQNLPDAERRLRVIASWKIDELPEYIRQYGFDNWIDVFYLRFSLISTIEYSIFLISVALLIINIF